MSLKLSFQGLPQMENQALPDIPRGTGSQAVVPSLIPRFEASNRHELLRLRTRSVLTGREYCWVFILAWKF